MKYKMIVSDFDGTLAYKGQIPQPTVDAIKRYIASGGIFIVCTGRAPQSIKDKIGALGISTVVSTHQGSLIVNIETDEVLQSGGLDYETASKIVEQVRKDDAAIAIIGDELIYEIPNRYSDVFINRALKVESIAEELKRRKQLVNRIVVSTVDEKVPKLIEKYSQAFKGKAIANSGASYIVEIISPSFTKKQSVEFLADYYGIPYNEIMAVGDSTNDIPLIDGKWHGVAIGNAHEQLKKVANEITVPFEEHPVKYLIEKYCLER